MTTSISSRVRLRQRSPSAAACRGGERTPVSRASTSPSPAGEAGSNRPTRVGRWPIAHRPRPARATSARSEPCLGTTSRGSSVSETRPSLWAHGRSMGSSRGRNGSRVYYANLAANFGAVLQPVQQGFFKGELGVAVSRLDNPTPTSIQDKDSWFRPVLAVRRGGTFSLEDKEQIWADNAASSHFFGNVYVCSANFRSAGLGVPVPIMVGYSTDGGDTWTTRQGNEQCRSRSVVLRSWLRDRLHDSHGQPGRRLPLPHELPNRASRDRKPRDAEVV